MMDRERARPTVLVVEDQLPLREALAEMLLTHGFAVVGAASNGTQAVAMARSVGPDLVLMDYRMPGMDGISATEAIRSTSPAARVVMFTAYDEASLSVDAKRAGASHLLVKGCSPALIVEALTDALRRTPGIPR